MKSTIRNTADASQICGRRGISDHVSELYAHAQRKCNEMGDDVRLAVFDGTYGEADKTTDGGEIRPRRPEIDEKSMESEKEKINTDGGDEITK